jgi:hypothetical protein
MLKRRVLHVLGAASLLSIALAALIAGAEATPSPSPTGRFIPTPTIEYLAYLPERPVGTEDIHLAIGTFEGYVFTANSAYMMVLTLRDSKTGKLSDYLVSADTTLNDNPLQCTPEQTIPEVGNLCEGFPADIIPGKTRLAVLSWPTELRKPGTDTIATFPDTEPRLVQEPSTLSASSLAPSPLVSNPQLYAVFWDYLPKRPIGMRDIHLAVGVFENYEFSTGLTAMTLTLKDSETGTRSNYLLSADTTTLNGKPLHCRPERKVNEYDTYCESFPRDIIPGKTRLAILFWPTKFPDPGTDTIVTVEH